MPGKAFIDLPRGVSKGVALLVALVVGTWFFAVPSLQDAVTGAPVDFAEPTWPLGYLLGAPLFGAWDSLSLLTLSQHYAVLVTLVAIYVASVSRAGRWRHPGRSGLAWVGLESGRAFLALLLLLAFYAAGLLVPRPMTGIRLSEGDALTVDFHSHTLHSHDGWALFSAADNRQWHEGGGFDAAYVTDHYTWAGVDDALDDNPTRAGERTVLLEGAEVRIHRRPTNILGDRSRYLFALDGDSIYMEPDSLRAAHGRGGPPPTLLYTMPGGLQFVVPYSELDPSGVIGIEINDGSPRGLEQVRSQRSEILALADSVDLALVGAANHHGWGFTAASWSVLRIPGWREMTGPQLGTAIEAALHRDRRDAVQVLERRMPYHDGSQVKIALTLPWLAVEHFRMLSPPERLSWLGWLAVVLVLGRVRARRGTSS